MGIDFVVYKGSQSGNIVKSTGHRDLGNTEALVKLTHSGVCGTDEHYLHAGIGLGHEGVGIVTEIGSAVTSLKVGDRVGFGWVHYVCGDCAACLSGTISFRSWC
jgi:D-arabinose 1-dehydrogenase-like Zn-dependent alcohol dehydrogenase